MSEPMSAEPATWAVRPRSVHVPAEEWRSPFATVRMAAGPLELLLAVSRLRNSGVAVHPPMAEGGTPAVGAASEVWAAIEEAAVTAVAADPVARRRVLGTLSPPTDPASP